MVPEMSPAEAACKPAISAGTIRNEGFNFDKLISYL